MTAVLEIGNNDAERTLFGLAAAVTGNFMFASSDAIVKVLSSHYSVFQLVVTQASFALIPLAIMLLREGGLRDIRVRHPRLVMLRGLLAGTGTIFGFFSFSQLPLAETYSIFFCTPILVTVLSIPILGERVGLHRWGAVIVGLIGIVVMVRPGFETLHLGHAAALVAAVIGAFTVLVMRRIARDEHHAVMVLAVVTGLIAVSLPGMILTFRTPTLHDMALFACGGLLMGSGQFLIVRSLSLAPASVVAPMQYTMMLWAISYGYLLFGTRIDPLVVLGALIVIASGLYIMNRERRRGRKNVRLIERP
ncbi:Permease of the drug/metabolite transporter (DMT) superfamily [Kaistia soli DSM 19436]|uniref:Permease of the drug/metabolite transporter (DMT) superfamily n=1 Tax=Kaistia soli DSM 19436 TaxID=1122133 RepID=A0A1M5AL40_9HYPH|nr:DMT family transporter [Kaistia soli]SHF30981.1 Permease of the drug/metabolite transporter (DMT) superfamily [Kaistia soli DSM 19436]